MKKVVSFLLVFVMVISIAMPSFAVEDEKSMIDDAIQKVESALEKLEKERGIVSEVVDKVNGSVVAIIGKNTQYREMDYVYSKYPNNLQHGSGVVIDEGGKILTNNHVIDGIDDIYVVTYDGKVYKAELLYADKGIDLALLEINRTDMEPIELADENEVKVGDEVVAIGTPLFFGYRNSASRGIISGLNRPVDRSYTYLQTDASVNPGNSGGPLVSMNGELVGINTLGYMYYQGMNFSITIGNINYFLDHYNKFGEIKRCYIGVEFEENWAALLGLPTNQGLKVVALQKDGILTSKDVSSGDTLEAINGEITTSIAQYNEILKKFLPGDTVTLTFSRNDKKFDIKVTLKEMPDFDENSMERGE